MNDAAAPAAFTHFAIVADGEIVDANDDFGTEPGPAIISMKAWASSADEAADMIVQISSRLSFKLAGEIEIYVTEPGMAAKDNPFGYDIAFSPYEPEDHTLQ